MEPWTPRRLSVVVPVYNEEGNVAPLVEQTVAVTRRLEIPTELVIVDDGSSDGTLAALRALLETTPELVVIALARNFGQTLALRAGFDRCRGDAIVTMDGDLQNDPRDIPRLLESLSGGADAVSGWRRHRQDDFLRTLTSRAANGLIRAVTGVPIHDQGCSLKAYRQEVVRRCELYSDMHRFIGVLTMAQGVRIEELEVSHYPRVSGDSKYGMSRIFKVASDLLTVQMITRFRDYPLRWFSLLGVPAFLATFAFGIAWLSVPGGSFVFPAVAFLAAMMSGFCLLCGLLGELILEAAPNRGVAAPIIHEWKSG